MSGSLTREAPSARALPVRERDERAAHRRLDLLDRVLVVRDRGEVVRAALDDDPCPRALGEEASFACGIVPAAEEHRIDAVDDDSVDATRGDGALERGANLAT